MKRLMSQGDMGFVGPKPLRLLATVACAALGASLAAWINMPLPWLLGALLAVAALMGWVFSRLHIPNAWVLGALVVGGACASQGLSQRLPDLGLLLAQLVIGWGLGKT